MNKKAFTLVELLAVIVILAIILAISIPSISSVIDNSEKSSFVSSTKLLINAVKIKLLEDETFDITTINKSNLKSILNIDDENYSSISFRYDINGKIYANIEGQGKWANLVTCGNYENISITDCIVRDGLILYLDSSNSNSYPGSGTNWYDLSGSVNNGTLVNVSYSSSDLGSMVFNGSNSYVSVLPSLLNSSIINSLTIECWVKASTASYTVIGGGQDNVGTRYIAAFNVNVLSSNEYGFDIEAVNGQVRLNSSKDSLQLNVWKHLVGTYNGSVAKFYINGVLVDTDTGTSGNVVDFDNFIMGKDIVNIRYFKGDISAYSIYNRELTAQEIVQNFNALRYRYGL